MEYFWSQHDHLSAISLLFSNASSDFGQPFEAERIAGGLDMTRKDKLQLAGLGLGMTPSADFEQMITQFRNRLRPPPALTVVDWLRVYVGLSGTTEDPRADLDFPPPRDDVHRQLVLRAVS